MLISKKLIKKNLFIININIIIIIIIYFFFHKLIYYILKSIYNVFIKINYNINKYYIFVNKYIEKHKNHYKYIFI